jgi:cellulose biosynthesis protein BcsQ
MREGRFVKLNQTDDLPEIPPEYDVIFDFGGYLDKRAITALKQADRVIVPVVNEFKDVHTTVNFIQEIEAYSQNIFIVANKTQKGDFTDIQAIMQKFYPKYPVFEIKHSRAMPNILKEKKSIREMVGEGGLKKFNYGAVDKQFNLLIKAIL